MEAKPWKRIGENDKSPSKCILIADDAISSRELLRSILASSGHEVVEATDGVEVLEAMISFRPALVILDMELSGINGYETARRVRRLLGFEAVPIIALVAAPAHVALEEITAAGFADYLVKPIGPARLRECVGRLLENTA